MQNKEASRRIVEEGFYKGKHEPLRSARYADAKER